MYVYMHILMFICIYRGVTTTVNVMCGKTDVEAMKHQLEALNVLRPKIAAIRRIFPEDSVPFMTVKSETATMVVDGVSTVESTTVVESSSVEATVVDSSVVKNEIKEES
jgi:hypothetical protein